MAEITITEAEQRRTTARILDVREEVEVAEGMIPSPSPELSTPPDSRKSSRP